MQKLDIGITGEQDTRRRRREEEQNILVKIENFKHCWRDRIHNEDIRKIEDRSEPGNEHGEIKSK